MNTYERYQYIINQFRCKYCHGKGVIVEVLLKDIHYICQCRGTGIMLTDKHGVQYNHLIDHNGKADEALINRLLKTSQCSTT